MNKENNQQTRAYFMDFAYMIITNLPLIFHTWILQVGNTQWIDCSDSCKILVCFLYEMLFCDAGCCEFIYFSTPQEQTGETYHLCSLVVFANLEESIAALWHTEAHRVCKLYKQNLEQWFCDLKRFKQNKKDYRVKSLFNH